MAGQRIQRYPPDVVLGFDERRGSFTTLCLGLVALAVVADLAVFGFPTTPIPYNYPFFGDILLLVLAITFLKLTHRTLWRVVDDLAQIVQRNKNDPLALDTDVEPADIRCELGNVLFLAFHPGVVAVGAVLVGGIVIGVMAALDVFSAYPYLILNFGFGAAHGIFIGPVLGSLYILRRTTDQYIIDIDLLDPDGVGGYREIGDGLVTLATYGIFFVTLDFVILSSVAFTQFTEFQIVISGLYVLYLLAFIGATFGATFLIRRRLLTIRTQKVALMQAIFNVTEHAFWERHLDGARTEAEAINILAMYAMFHQMSRMQMWPINLYSLSKLTLSVGFSLAIFLLENTGFLL